MLATPLWTLPWVGGFKMNVSDIILCGSFAIFFVNINFQGSSLPTPFSYYIILHFMNIPYFICAFSHNVSYF